MRWAETGALLVAAERWLLPGVCLHCGEPSGPADPLVCNLCRNRWRRLPHPQCGRCGQPSPGGGATCRICAEWPEDFRQCRSAVWLDDGARRSVHALKYQGWWRVAEAMAASMRPLLGDAQGGVLVPVPLGPRRASRRGYNQAQRLAGALATFAGPRWREAPDLLSRVRETPSQTSLPPEARRANVATAFEARDPAGFDPARLVLVDDVFTTGATLAAAARALLDAGAEAVEAITFARARPPLD